MLFVACADGQILAWDFTDTSFKASIELKATHSKITSMEFLSSNNSKHQLLAVGDEQGTLHIFEVPRNLTRPVHKEDSIMLKFLEREIEVSLLARLLSYWSMRLILFLLQREDVLKTQEPEVEEEEESNIPAANTHHDKRVGTTAGSADMGALGLDGTSAEEAAKAAREKLVKEEEEFLKLEAAFINELGLSGEQLPSFLSQ